MKARPIFLRIAVAGLLVLGVNTGCESTGGSAGGSIYYGTGWYDPWYYGSPWRGDTIIISPPPRPGWPAAPPRPSPRPLPSIPATPRPAIRR